MREKDDNLRIVLALGRELENRFIIHGRRMYFRPPLKRRSWQTRQGPIIFFPFIGILV
jgi:hypothetical protein